MLLAGVMGAQGLMGGTGHGAAATAGMEKGTTLALPLVALAEFLELSILGRHHGIISLSEGVPPPPVFLAKI
jgi:hypothetical protein